MDTLEAAVKGMQKTADNDMFEIHSYDEPGGTAWMTYTIFKRPYSKLKAGDVVVNLGKTSSEIKTFRRRFGSLSNARKNLNATILLALAILNPGTSTPDDSLHGIQTGAPSMGPYKRRHDYDHPEGPSNRDGFNRPAPRRKEDTERNVLPYEDSEMSNQVKVFGEIGNFSAPVVEAPEDRAWKEQDVPVPLNLDPKRPFPNKRKRPTERNEMGITNEYSGNPKTEYI